ncbi:MAG TPA: hypothetical protein VI413_03760 [Paludibacter sp.]
MKKLLFLLTFTFAIFTANALIYSVTVPTGTKACYIAGDMNGWNQQLMTKVNETHYTIEIPIANTTHKYKYCSGPGWGFVEKAADGSEIDNRSYAVNDIVAGWAAIYDKSVKNVSVKYNVTVPQGTQCCYIVGGWNGWKTFRAMKRIDATHFTVTILSNKLFKYNYFAGKGWGYMELGANKIVRADRNYSTDDVVLDWAAVYDKAVPDADITYSVTVPEGTNSCYIAGSWNRWLFLEMEKVDSRHFSITLRSNKALKYLYLSGPDWNCIEVNPGKNGVFVRSYSDNDVVLGWKSVWKQKNE